MFLLCKYDEGGYGEYTPISASSDKEVLQQEAAKLCREHYEREYADWCARYSPAERKKMGKLKSPEEGGWEEYFVREVPDWPKVEFLL